MQYLVTVVIWDNYGVYARLDFSIKVLITNGSLVEPIYFSFEVCIV